MENYTSNTNNNTKSKNINLLQCLMLILLILNVVLNCMTIFSKSSNETKSVQTMVAESKALEDYYKKIGKENLKVYNDKVLTSTYGSDKITGTIENTGNKEFETVSIQFKLYENGVYVGSASDYVYFSAPGSKLTFEASAFNVESFDEYELYYISACE